MSDLATLKATIRQMINAFSYYDSAGFREQSGFALEATYAFCDPDKTPDEVYATLRPEFLERMDGLEGLLTWFGRRPEELKAFVEAVRASETLFTHSPALTAR